MHTKILILLILCSLVWSHDITVGSNAKGRKIFDETREASPAIWRQIENVTIIAPSDELISGVIVTDMRPDKDGDAKVVDGGEGKQSVTLELKSPTVLRGYEFHIEIFSVPETMFTDAEERLFTGDEVTPQIPDKTTKSPESTTDKDVPAVVAQEMNSENIRPARETEDKGIPKVDSLDDITSQYETSTISDRIGLPLSLGQEETTENNKNDGTTTEIESTMTSVSEAITTAPITFDNSKNIPDYPSLSILDYIKSKEGTINIRHTVDNSKPFNIEVTEISLVTSSEEPTSTSLKDDDTADLIPPAVGTSYNEDFTETVTAMESTTPYINKPRAGRGLNFDSITENEAESTPVPSTTEVVATLNTDSTDVASIDYEQSRNIRDAKKDVEDDYSNIEDIPKHIDTPNEQTTTCNSKMAGENIGNVIVINKEQLAMTADDNKMQFALPIVLIIGSENNFPTIKIITENTSTDLENKFILYATQPTGESVEENDSGIKTVESDKPDDVYMPSGYYDQKT